MKRILLIGGAGYIGSVLTAYLLKKGYIVTVLDNLIYGNYSSLLSYLGDPGLKLIVGDMNDPTMLQNASGGVNTVILLAGLVGDPITKR